VTWIAEVTASTRLLIEIFVRAARGREASFIRVAHRSVTVR
jgi:hypothetical protein